MQCADSEDGRLGLEREGQPLGRQAQRRSCALSGGAVGVEPPEPRAGTSSAVALSSVGARTESQCDPVPCVPRLLREPNCRVPRLPNFGSP